MLNGQNPVFQRLTVDTFESILQGDLGAGEHYVLWLGMP
jgi:hypothetical protein